MYLPYVHMLLTTEVAEIAEEIRKLFQRTDQYVRQGCDRSEAFERAVSEVKENVGEEIADCLAYLSKIANFFSRDMEQDYVAKMEQVRARKNPYNGF